MCSFCLCYYSQKFIQTGWYHAKYKKYLHWDSFLSCTLKSCVCPPNELSGRELDGGTRLVWTVTSALIKCCRDLWHSMSSWASNIPLGSSGNFSWPGATILKGHWFPNAQCGICQSCVDVVDVCWKHLKTSLGAMFRNPDLFHKCWLEVQGALFSAL